MKRAGFTMIELIFVIVILGILAAVAVPKLAATRSDAEVAARATQIQTAVNEIGAYAAAMDTFDVNLSAMSVAVGAMEAASQATISTAAGSAVINDTRSPGTATACISILQATRPWTGVAATDAAAAITPAVWTAASWANNSLTKLIQVTHTANTSGGCDTLQSKIPAGETSVKGRSAQF